MCTLSHPGRMNSGFTGASPRATSASGLCTKTTMLQLQGCPVEGATDSKSLDGCTTYAVKCLLSRELHAGALHAATICARSGGFGRDLATFFVWSFIGGLIRDSSLTIRPYSVLECSKYAAHISVKLMQSLRGRDMCTSAGDLASGFSCIFPRICPFLTVPRDDILDFEPSYSCLHGCFGSRKWTLGVLLLRGQPGASAYNM